MSGIDVVFWSINDTMAFSSVTNGNHEHQMPLYSVARKNGQSLLHRVTFIRSS